MEIALQAETLLSYDVGSVKGNNGNKISNEILTNCSRKHFSPICLMVGTRSTKVATL